MKVLFRSNTVNYMRHGAHVISDMNLVTFGSYELDSKGNVTERGGKATLIVKEKDDPLFPAFSPKSRFILLVADKPDFSASPDLVPDPYETISLFKTSTEWKNLHIRHELESDTDISLTFF